MSRLSSQSQNVFGRFAAPIAAAESARPFRLGLLGGTFDPVHYGHLLLAQSAFEQHQLDGVLFIPTGRPARKLSFTTTAAELRFELLRLALADDERFGISRIELDREGLTYTIDSLRTLAELAASRACLFWIVGADALADLPTWKDAAAIAELVEVLFACRPGTSAEELKSVTAPGLFRTAIIEQPLIDISATWLRTRVAEGKRLDYLTPTPVAAHIQELGLYRASVTSGGNDEKLRGAVDEKFSGAM